MPGHQRKRRVVASLAIALFVATACTAPSSPSDSVVVSDSPSSRAPQSRAPASDAGAALVAAAAKEGRLTTIGLQHDWCNYGEALKTFEARYGIELNELNPDAAFGDQLDAVRDNKDNKGPQAPDIIDVGLPFGAQAKAAGLLAPFKVSTWDSIPGRAKDPGGFWYGGYYGILSFETNKALVPTAPTDWSSLLDASHERQVALPGDPRVSDQAIQAVFASSLANGGSLDNAQPGLDFFAKLQKAGNLVPSIATAASIGSGTTPVAIRWTYSALTHRDAVAGSTDIEVTVPKKGRLGGLYVQAISAFAPHPNAAKLWMEFLYSDEGQNIWLRGYCNPVRFEDMSNRNAIPPETLAKLPDTAGAVFPTPDQLDKASALITQRWDAVVGADIK